MRIDSPYDDLRWERIERHRAQLHVHEPRNPIDVESAVHEPATSEGLADPHAVDDDAASPGKLVEKYRNAGYSALAITEHEHVTPDSEHRCVTPGTSWPWSRWDRDPDRLGMVAFQGAELRGMLPDRDVLHDVVSLDNGLEHGERQPIEDVVGEIETGGGLAVLAHPGKYVGADEWEAYVPVFESFPALLGVEVFNADDRYPSRGIWDGLLSHFGVDRPIWGFGNDDYHARPRDRPRFDRSRTVLLVPELTPEAVRDALCEGRSYVQYDGSAEDGAPAIERIDVTRDAITIYAPGATGIDWIEDGEVVHSGDAVTRETVEDCEYVRAEVYGEDDAVTCTQPFFVEGER